MYKIALNRIADLFARLADGHALYVPARCPDTGTVAFTPWRDGDSILDLQTLKTTLSPKQFYFTVVEPLYSATCSATITPAPLPDTPFVVFGVRACDAAGIEILDTIFLGEPADTHYKARRDASVMITLACDAPGTVCFCGAFGIAHNQPQGDVRTRICGAWLYWEPLTEKGSRVTNKVKDLLTRARLEDISADVQPPAPPATPAKPTLPNLSECDTLSLFNAPVWDTLHMGCVACGTCTFLCPTCHCYDIAFTQEVETTQHCRRWDACLNASFTQMAHGNPRPTKKERFRQRFMHKLVYHREKHGVPGCVGCGRCVSRCPANINIINVAHALASETGGNA